MDTKIATTNTDSVNRSNMIFPACALAKSIERHIKEKTADGTEFGMVSLVSHDHMRPIGWTIPLGLHLSGTIARQATVIQVAETTEELKSVAAAHHRAEGVRLLELVKERGDTFRQRLGTLGDGADYQSVGTALALEAPGLAAALYPDLFDDASANVDKDGLVSLTELLSRFDVIAPGIFKDRARNVLVYAHHYFRRSLAPLNTLNETLLEQLLALHKASRALNIRLKLDPDRLGDPPLYGAIELEHRWGPVFQDDIAQVSSGVTKHAADNATKLYCGVEFTEFWWKDVEERPDGTRVRTFEMEELPDLDVPSAGVGKDYFGARHLHAEYTEGVRAITHFDGAIRGYRGEKYLARQDADIKSAGKHAEYTKLFRVDGPVQVDDWKRITCAYFRNNNLVPEYFSGKPSEVQIRDEKTQQLDRASSVPIEGMIAYIPAADLPLFDGLVLRSFEKPITVLEQDVWPFDAPPQHTAAFFGAFTDFEENVLIEFPDGNVNLPSMVFGYGINRPELDKIFQDLAEAIATDKYAAKVACSFLWRCEDYWVALSLMGFAPQVASVLRASVGLVDPAVPPSTWIASWKDVVCADRSPDLEGGMALRNLRTFGLLSYQRHMNGQTSKIRVPRSHPLFGPMSKGVPGAEQSPDA